EDERLTATAAKGIEPSPPKRTLPFVAISSTNKSHIVYDSPAMPNAIVHFEIPADDVQRAKKFYEEAFCWKISDPWNMNYFIVETRKDGEVGINGGLMPRQNPGQPFTYYTSAASIAA